MPDRHHPLTIAMHWLTVLLLLVGVGCVLGRELTDDKVLRATLLAIHRSCGLLVLWAMALRLLARWVLTTHKVNAGLPTAMRIGSRLVHAALYLGLTAIPVLGWVLTNAKGQPVHLLELFPLPTLVARDRDLAETLQGWHETLAWILMALATLHAMVGLGHHYLRKDTVLRSMLPQRQPSQP